MEVRSPLNYYLQSLLLKFNFRSLLGGKVVRSSHRYARSVEDTFEDQPTIFMLTSLLDMGLQSVLESLQSLQG